MNYPMMDAIVCYAKLHLGEDISEYSEIIMQYYKSHGLENPLIMELCNYFFSKNLVKEPLLDELTTYIDRLRRAGDRTTLILNLLFLADRYAKLNLINEKDEILIEVFELHTKYNYFGTLILYPYEVLPRLTKMFPKVKKYLLDYSVETLTNKEIEIMKLIKDGYTNNQIKETLYISIGTVKWHINNIFSKLGVDNRVAAINEAHRRKII
jgi:LuxR family maltose regulon positive regulatory protein